LKTSDRKGAWDRVLLVVEVVASSGDSGSFGLVFSLPGRDGTLEKRWPLLTPGLTQGQAQDIVNTASKLILDALVTKLGVQQDLTLPSAG
jgi:hypothetical protein